MYNLYFARDKHLYDDDDDDGEKLCVRSSAVRG